MEYLAMIQARCGSSRLPGKVLKDLCGKPMLLRMVERVKRSVEIDDVIVVTTIEKSDLPVVSLCSSNGIRVFVGSENDVLDRYYQAARLLKPKYVVRLTADCPCFDPELLDEAIHQMTDEADYLGMMSETFPDGLDLEILRFGVLVDAWKNARLSSEREHVTQYVVKRQDEYSCQDYICEVSGLGNERWTVDEPEDFEMVSRVYEHFDSVGKVDSFGYRDVLDFLERNPEVHSLNNVFSRNEGLAKSLCEDRVLEIGPWRN